jgi:stage V sporulation protein B
MLKKIKARVENVTKSVKLTGNTGSASRLLKGAFILTAAGIVVKFIGSLNWIILSRVLGGEGIGIYQMAFPLYLLALSVSSAGIPVAISIITAEKIALLDYRGAARTFKISLVLLIITGFLVSLLLYFGAGWLIKYHIIRDGRAYYALVALSPAIFLVTILSSFRGYLQGWQVMTPTAVSQIVEQLFRVATMLIFATILLPRGLEFAAGGASLGAGAGAAAALLVVVYYLKKTANSRSQIEERGIVQESNASIIRRMAKLAIPISLSSIMLPLVANLDLLVVPLRLEHAGFSVAQATELFGYLTGMAVPLVNLATIFTAALATSLVPAISQMFSLGEAQEVLQQIAGAMRLANITTIPFGVTLLVLANPIVSVLYHAPGAGGATRVMAAGVFLLGIHQVTTGVLQGLGRTAIPVINMGVSAIFKVALTWGLTAIPKLGIQGAAWATLADIGIAAALNLYFVHHYTGFFLSGRDLSKNIVAGILMGVIMYFGYGLLVTVLDNQFLAICMTLLSGGLIYGGIMFALGGINCRDIAGIPFIGTLLKKS